jgi:hypothetical protein
MNKRSWLWVWGAIALLVVGALTGPGAWADSGADHKVAQPYPILLGTSGGNALDSSKVYCCSGTLGALVQDSFGTIYILSNNHVIGRSNLAAPGEPVNHPGLIDQNCGKSGVIAEVSYVHDLLYGSRKNPGGPNLADAAVAQVLDPAYVAADGAILDIGPVSASILEPAVGLGVQKSGRTTGHTKSTVAAIGVEVLVAYSESCGGPSKNYALFTNQFRIGGAEFSAGGDSGSLIVEQAAPGSLPRAVGLLFAGNSTSTLASPISAVFDAFASSHGIALGMVSGTPPPPPVYGAISGTVTDEALAPIAGATVTVGGTAASATTDGAGNYTVADVPVGTRSVTASATGYATSAPQSVEVVENETTSGVDFVLAALTSPTQSIARCIVYQTQGGRNQSKDLVFTVRVVDDFGDPVPGAQVNISVTRDGSLYGTGTGATTSTSGEASYTASNAPNGAYVTTVTAIVKSGLTFEGSTPANSFAKGTDASPAEFCSFDTTLSTQSDQGRGSVARALKVKQQHGARLMAIPGVVGHGVGSANGDAVIEVYLENENAAANVPRAIDGVSVRVIVTGEFVAY